MSNPLLKIVYILFAILNRNIFISASRTWENALVPLSTSVLPAAKKIAQHRASAPNITYEARVPNFAENRRAIAVIARDAVAKYEPNSVSLAKNDRRLNSNEGFDIPKHVCQLVTQNSKTMEPMCCGHIMYNTFDKLTSYTLVSCVDPNSNGVAVYRHRDYLPKELKDELVPCQFLYHKRNTEQLSCCYRLDFQQWDNTKILLKGCLDSGETEVVDWWFVPKSEDGTVEARNVPYGQIVDSAASSLRPQHFLIGLAQPWHLLIPLLAYIIRAIVNVAEFCDNRSTTNTAMETPSDYHQCEGEIEKPQQEVLEEADSSSQRMDCKSNAKKVFKSTKRENNNSEKGYNYSLTKSDSQKIDHEQRAKKDRGRKTVVKSAKNPKGGVTILENAPKKDGILVSSSNSSTADKKPNK